MNGIKSNYLQGTVRVFKSQQGYGFIAMKDGNQLFFHSISWRDESVPTPGDRVEFELGPSKNKQFNNQAINIKKIDTTTSVAGTDTLATPVLGQKDAPEVK
jgi:cold shock CspA family protein